jgi:proteasome assembly chaperone (PAC2) family protein
MKNDRVDIYNRIKVDEAKLVVGWRSDVGKIGRRVINFLNISQSAELIAEIQPESFYALMGVSVEKDIIQFPQAQFYHLPGTNIITLKSDIPHDNWYDFLTLILDVSTKVFGIRQFYTIAGIPFLLSHTMPRSIITAVSNNNMKTIMSTYGFPTEVDYESPLNQPPDLNAYLIWLAGRHKLAAAGMWLPIPFYLANRGDASATREFIAVISKLFKIDLDITNLEKSVIQEREQLEYMRDQIPEIDKYIGMLEKGLSLTPEETDKLTQETENFFKGEH